jgi:hypothetical protein
VKVVGDNWYFFISAALLSGAAQQLKSPNEAFTMDFSLQNDGTPTYALKYKTKVIKASKLGLELKTTTNHTE